MEQPHHPTPEAIMQIGIIAEIEWLFTNLAESPQKPEPKNYPLGIAPADMLPTSWILLLHRR